MACWTLPSPVMRIDVNDSKRQRRGQISVESSLRPVRVPLEEDDGEVFLNWDGTLDDDGQLRKCLCCGCPNLYRIRSLPSFTPVIVILAFVGAAVGLLGYGNNPVVLPLLITVLVVEIMIVIVSRTRLVCYRCRSRYADLPIAPYHGTFDREYAELPENNSAADAANTNRNAPPGPA